MSLADDAVRGYNWTEPPPPCPPFAPDPPAIPEWQIAAYEYPTFTFEQLLNWMIEARETYKITGRGL